MLENVGLFFVCASPILIPCIFLALFISLYRGCKYFYPRLRDFIHLRHHRYIQWKSRRALKENKMRINLNDLLTIRQAAEEVGVVRQTICEWIKSGFLPHVSVGHVRLVKRDDVQRAKEAKAKRNKAHNFEAGKPFQWKKELRKKEEK